MKEPANKIVIRNEVFEEKNKDLTETDKFNKDIHEEKIGSERDDIEYIKDDIEYIKDDEWYEKNSLKIYHWLKRLLMSRKHFSWILMKN